ncbi:MAG: protein translocase subunit SecD [Gammaproteobacteria bacterium]
MLNQYPLWKYLLLAGILIVGALYALPNVYGSDPALQITTRSGEVDVGARDKIAQILKQHNIAYRSISTGPNGVLVRFKSVEDQLKANDDVRNALGSNYIVALNLASAAPHWLSDFNAKPMYLGLDLRGGLHFLMQVDTKAALQKQLEGYVGDFRNSLREAKIHYRAVMRNKDQLELKFPNVTERDKAYSHLSGDYRGMSFTEQLRDGYPYLIAKFTPKKVREVEKTAVQQNITTLRKRVNELGVAEPIIQQEGEDRIVVQLPGIQDSAHAKQILGATATLEFHLVDVEHSVQEAVDGHVPPGSQLYHWKSGKPELLKKRIIVTGDQITDASSGFDQQTGQPSVNVSLNGTGARIMAKTTQENLKKPMAVVFIEQKTRTKMVDGKKVTKPVTSKEVINVATIQSVFSRRFQITGLDSAREAHDLALLLRAGALAAPMHIAEERTIGPSLGKQNIDQGKESVIIGFVFVLVFMALYYKLFGMIANVALAVNLVLIVALLSMLQATLTLPGIAGIVLTVGMSVDANVLIFERIREELRAGNTPQASIHAGYEKAFSTIADANITTLIAAVVLYALGTGPVQGFAVTLSLGIATSMLTAIMGTRAIANLIYGGRRLSKLSI